MTANLQEQINHLIAPGSQATQLNDLIQCYRLCARSEGESQKTIRITITALTTPRGFLEASGYSTDVTVIGVYELREFILHLQHVKAYERHPLTRPQNKGLSRACHQLLPESNQSLLVAARSRRDYYLDSHSPRLRSQNRLRR